MKHRIGVVLTLVACTGCATTMRNQSLQSVARDWCMVIRASQVIPVYPLTEDLQPGDLFLVRVPVQNQHAEYEQKGFLALDNHIQRLEPSGYPTFYDGNFKIGGTDKPLPATLLAAQDASGWAAAPNASFPSYSFSVRTGGGFSLALPVQGVPIGLSLLGAEAAEGSVTIADARTYGLDTVSLFKDVRAWALENTEFLNFYASTPERPNYLRVVSRIYVTGRLNVSITSAKSRSGELSAGNRAPVDLIVPSASNDPSKDALDAYSNNIKSLNTTIEGSLKAAAGAAAGGMPVSGSVKIVAASARSITLSEDFTRPLVVGYLGFDMAIGPGGALGPPIPTQAVLTKQQSTAAADSAPVQALQISAQQSFYQIIRKRADAGEQAAIGLKRDLDQLAALLPETWPCNVHGFDDPNGPLKVTTAKGLPLRSTINSFGGVLSYQGTLTESAARLEEALGYSSIPVEGHQPRTDATKNYLNSERTANLEALKQVQALIASRRPLLESANHYATQAP